MNNNLSVNPILIFLLLSIGFFGSFEVLASEKIIIGWIEKVSINGTGFTIRAKIDSGAKNSSLNAEKYIITQKDGENWIKFNITNKEKKTITLNKKIVRFAKIRRKKAQPQDRPVIEIELCLGGIKKLVEVNLVNRSNFNYQMLVGRSYLQKDFLIDIDKKYTSLPICDR